MLKAIKIAKKLIKKTMERVGKAEETKYFAIWKGFVFTKKIIFVEESCGELEQ
jgi:hypothetical protein